MDIVITTILALLLSSAVIFLFNKALLNYPDAFSMRSDVDILKENLYERIAGLCKRANDPENGNLKGIELARLVDDELEFFSVIVKTNPFMAMIASDYVIVNHYVDIFSSIKDDELICDDIRKFAGVIVDYFTDSLTNVNDKQAYIMPKIAELYS